MFVQAVRIEVVHSPTDDGFNMTRGRMNLPGVKGSAAASSLGPAKPFRPHFLSPLSRERRVGLAVHS